jgi:hypothetical protein
MVHTWPVVSICIINGPEPLNDINATFKFPSQDKSSCNKKLWFIHNNTCRKKISKIKIYTCMCEIYRITAIMKVNRHYHQYHGQSNRTSQTHCDFTDKNNNISFETFKWDLQKLMLLFLLATSHDVTLTDNIQYQSPHDVTLTDNIQYQSQFIVTDNNSRWDERKNVLITDKHVFFFKWYDNCL